MNSMTLTEFALHLAKLPLVIAVEQHHALEEACKVVEEEAKHAIGHYQLVAGPFAEWEQLSPNTLYGGVSPSGFRYPGKIPLGYATDTDHNPELREGDLRDSIEHKVQLGMSVVEIEGAVGSDSDVMVWQELGTQHMPARSILGGAAVRKADIVAELLGRAAVMTLAGVGRSVRIP